jgi:hypothetical protein
VDLNVFGQALWRYRIVVWIGLALSLTLALLSVVRIEWRDGRPVAIHRQSELWQASTTLMLTQEAFPWGRTELAVPEDAEPLFANPDRLAYVASSYARLASADAVQSRVLRNPEQGVLTAVPVTEEGSGDSLPFVDLLGLAETPRAAADISRRGTAVFIHYIAKRQAQAGIPPNERVLLQLVKGPFSNESPRLVQGRKKTTAMFVFLATMTATFGLAFVLDNLRQRRRPAVVPDEWRDAREARERALSGP